MISKKSIVIAALCASLPCILLLQSSAPPLPGITAFEQEPPIPKKFHVQKMATPLPAGQNMIMRIEYEPNATLSPTMNIYYGNLASINFRDDGVAPDITANDAIYAAYYTENIPNFISKITARQANLAAKTNGFLHFTGHAGELITTPPSFDITSFNEFEDVEIDVVLLDAQDCTEDLYKERSLFITDLSVVEDPARTYNVVNPGGTNPNGVWTFGNLIRNIANQPGGYVSPKVLLKQWIKRWTAATVINGQTVPARLHVAHHLIGPWLEKANPGMTGPNYYANNTNVLNTWEAIWDATPDHLLLQNAPFKLTAIVNRIDLRGNQAYSSSFNNAGEVRFIYTLIAPIPLNGGSPGTPTPAGMPPRGGDGSGGNGGCVNPADWEGMNVILEYGIPAHTKCELKAYAQGWANLSDHALGTAAYNSALESLTHMVIDMNADPARANNNRSAINRIRTNERIFFEADCGIQNQSTWPPSNWELSQFEIDATTHLLKPAPVTNTPTNEANISLQSLFKNGMQYNMATSSPQSLALLEWSFTHKPQIHNGSHNLPLSYTYAGNTVNLAGTAIVDAESVHFWDFDWGQSTAHHTAIPYSSTTSYPYEKEMRRQFSVNTCQGCHAGENKTVFTQVRPMGYGIDAKYWSSNPIDYTDYKTLDVRFQNYNAGTSTINGPQEPNHVLPPNEFTNNYFTRVSAFLTGRNYSGTGTYDDDIPGDDAIDAVWDDETALFYVFDPINMGTTAGDGTYPLSETYFGYNDLQMRKQHLCAFINAECDPFSIPLSQSVTLALIQEVSFMPLPRGGH